jgi:hypothetical protein
MTQIRLKTTLGQDLSKKFADQSNGTIYAISGKPFEPTKTANLNSIPTIDQPEVKRRSNEDIVMELMNSSQFGAMSQVFVVNAIRSYAATIAAAPEPESDGNGFISNIAWHRVAVETMKRMDLMYKQNAEVVLNEEAKAA